MTERNGNKAPDWGISYGISELWSEVAPGLFVGGTADNDTVADPRRLAAGGTRLDIGDGEITLRDFDAVVTMYAWAQPVDWGVEELRWGIMDGNQPVDRENLLETAVWAHRRWKAGKRVMVRCQAGLNRSSLVAAVVLMIEGYTVSEAISMIRVRRSRHCLFNKSFTRLLVELWRSEFEPREETAS